MYSVRLGYSSAISRISTLVKNKHHAESFVTTVFTIEKTIRRVLTELIISAGFKSKFARKYVKQINGISRLIAYYEFYDPDNRNFDTLFGRENRLQINDWATMRNRIVHGERVYGIDVLKKATNDALIVLEHIKTKSNDHFGFNGWDRLSVRVHSRLHHEPTSKITSPKALTISPSKK